MCAVPFVPRDLPHSRTEPLLSSADTHSLVLHHDLFCFHATRTDEYKLFVLYRGQIRPEHVDGLSRGIVANIEKRHDFAK